MTPPAGTPLLTVGLMTHASAGDTQRRWFEALVADLKAQSFTDWELIVNVNGGTPARAEELTRWTEGLPLRAIYCQRTPQPALDNQRGLFQMSRGRYFAWVADHDRYPPTSLATLVAHLDAHPGTALAYGRSVLIGPDDVPLSAYDDALDTRGLAPPQRGIATMHRLSSCNQFYGMWRAEALAKMDLHHQTRGHDHSWIFQAALLGDVVQVPEVAFLRRKNRPDAPIDEDEARIAALSFRADEEVVRRIPWCHLTWIHLAQAERLLPPADAPLVQTAVLEHFFSRYAQRLVNEIRAFAAFTNQVDRGQVSLSPRLVPQFHHALGIVRLLAQAVQLDVRL
jgi:hypothetical protein